jgi:hypothetical protein
VWWLNDWEERLQESGSWLVAVLKIRRDSGQTAGQVGFCTRIERMKRGGTKRTEKRSHDCLPRGSPPALDICHPLHIHARIAADQTVRLCRVCRPSHGTLCVSTTASLGAMTTTSLAGGQATGDGGESWAAVVTTIASRSSTAQTIGGNSNGTI